MLVLTRKEGEAVHVGGIVVRVLDVNGGRVRLGFQGPPEIPVTREEVLARQDARPNVNFQEIPCAEPPSDPGT